MVGITERRLVAALAGGLVGLAAITLTAGHGIAQAPSPNAAPPAKDTIVARKVLMGTIGNNMDEIEGMLEPGQKFDSAEAREHADLISVMLQSFPHMFPPATNQWKAGAVRDPAYDTFAAPSLWDNFADFYARATAASKAALDASRATTRAEYRDRIADLRAGCAGCHAAYTEPDDKP